MFKMFQESKSIKWIDSQKDLIDFSPAYQRRGGIWKLDQKQLLIDSILNGFDLPKFYFQFMPPVMLGKAYSYAIIDGKQRIEAILGFLHDDYPLSENFAFFDQSLSEKFGDISGKLFSEIDQDVPAIAARFLQYELSIVFMDTTNPESVDVMFVRLNSGVPVNMAEKRKAMGGKLSKRIQNTCDSAPFFIDTIAITNNRCQHNDLALKLLMIELGMLDLTKKHVDKFVADNRDVGRGCEAALVHMEYKLQRLNEAFVNKDKLLKKNIIITLYYMLGVLGSVSYQHLRGFLEWFEQLRTQAQNDENTQDSDLNVFSRLLQQGADKKSSIQQRSDIMRRYYDQYVSATQPDSAWLSD